MEERLPQRHVAQRGRAEQAAVLRAIPIFRAQRTAQPEIEVLRICVHRERAIARHADRDEAEVRERRECAARTAAALVAARAVALGRIVEEVEPALLLLRESSLVADHGVVLARIRIELGGVLLEHFDRSHDRVERGGRVVEDVLAERAPEVRRVRCSPYGCDDTLDVRVRHLERRKERQLRLLMRIARPPVPGETAGGTVVDALVEILVEIVLGEERHVLQIAQRRHCALPLRAAVPAAGLHRLAVRWPVRVRRIVTARARLFMRRRQVAIEEHQSPECFDCSERRMRRRDGRRWRGIIVHFERRGVSPVREN